MGIINLAERRNADLRSLVTGQAGNVAVDVLVEGPLASKVAKHLLSRLIHLLPATPVLHEEAHLTAARVVDDIVDGLRDQDIPFVSISVGAHLEPSTGPSGTVVADPADPCAVLPSLVVAVRHGRPTALSTAIAAPKSSESLVSASVSSTRLALSTVLARTILNLGPTEATPMVLTAGATGLAVAANGEVHPCF